MPIVTVDYAKDFRQQLDTCRARVGEFLAKHAYRFSHQETGAFACDLEPVRFEIDPDSRLTRLSFQEILASLGRTERWADHVMLSAFSEAGHGAEGDLLAPETPWTVNGCPHMLRLQIAGESRGLEVTWLGPQYHTPASVSFLKVNSAHRLR